MKRICRGGAVLLVAVLALPWSVRGQSSLASETSIASAPLLVDVPFVPQSEALCGGAALAMVLRFHGATDVFAEDFADLVVDSGVGITTTDLVQAARVRGMDAAPFIAERDVVRALLAARRPVIALIENRPGVYHYIVVLAWADGRVLFHDPAIGPHQVMAEQELLRAWEPAGYWAMLAEPASASAQPATASRASAQPATTSHASAQAAASAPVATRTAPAIELEPPGDACTARLEDAARAAASEAWERAEHALVAADLVCSSADDVLRERAGLRFRQQRYGEAAGLAQQLAARQSTGDYAWELLAASRFLLDDRAGALDAWNRMGRPARDLVRIDGLHRTPYDVVEHAIDIAAGARVSAAALAAARRRVEALPTVTRARIDYAPATNGAVHVDAAILERRPLPHGWPDLVVHGARTVIDARLRVDIANALSLGELWHLEGGWQQNRRAIGIGVRAPGVLGMRAVTTLQGGIATAAFQDTATAAFDDAGPAPFDDAATDAVHTRRASVALAISDWATGALQWSAGLSLNDWAHRATYGGALAGLDVHLADERVVVNGAVEAWLAPHDGDRFGRMHVQTTLRTGRSERARTHERPAADSRLEPFEALLVLGARTTSGNAPRDLWSGAGTGRGTHALLRAHPLVDDDGVIRSAYWAPSLVHATLELRHWLTSIGPLRIGVAAFADAAAASGGPVARHNAVDAGGGLRLALAGWDATLRIDAAHGLGSDAAAISVGWGVRE